MVARLLASIIGWGGDVAVRCLAASRVHGRPFVFALQVNGSLRGWDLSDPYKPHRAISQRLPVPPSVRAGWPRARPAPRELTSRIRKRLFCEGNFSACGQCCSHRRLPPLSLRVDSPFVSAPQAVAAEGAAASALVPTAMHVADVSSNEASSLTKSNNFDRSSTPLCIPPMPASHPLAPSPPPPLTGRLPARRPRPPLRVRRRGAPPRVRAARLGRHRLPVVLLRIRGAKNALLSRLK